MMPTRKTLSLFSIAAVLAWAAVAPQARADAVPASDRFVVITDSHGVGAFGEALVRWLRQRPATEFDFFASGASAPLQWINGAFTTPCGFRESSREPRPEPFACKKLHTPKLASLWKEQGPRLSSERRISVIAQGTNYGIQPAMRREQIVASVRLIEAAQAASDRCLWVGPPRMKASPGFDTAGVEYKYALIREAIAQAAARTGKPACELIDSRAFSHYPAHGGDGIHYHRAGMKSPEAIRAAEEWAEGVTEAAGRLLSG
jgi:hypothetical protein